MALGVLLADEARCLATARFVVECADAATQERVAARLSQVTEEVTGALASKTSDHLNSVQGKAELKEEIVRRIKARLGAKGIRDVYLQHLTMSRD